MYETDLTKQISSLSATAGAFNRLYELVKTLRSPEGCPWDREQTPLSMSSDLIEETFEAVDAISQEQRTQQLQKLKQAQRQKYAQNDKEQEAQECQQEQKIQKEQTAHCREELGDVLLNTVMISYMFEQEGGFSLFDCINDLCDKLITRHPHVFLQSRGQVVVQQKATTSDEVLMQWDKIKTQVEGRKEKSILDSVPQGFPPLLKAYKFQKKAAKQGFDFNKSEDAAKKIVEEIVELYDAQKEGDGTQITQEAGDLLFSCINYIRKLNVDPLVALSSTNKKFYERFCFVEEQMQKANLQMAAQNMNEMQAFWQAAKEKGL